MLDAAAGVEPRLDGLAPVVLAFLEAPLPEDVALELLGVGVVLVGGGHAVGEPFGLLEDTCDLRLDESSFVPTDDRLAIGPKNSSMASLIQTTSKSEFRMNVPV